MASDEEGTRRKGTRRIRRSILFNRASERRYLMKGPQCPKEGYHCNPRQWPKGFPYLGKVMGFNLNHVTRLSNVQLKDFYSTMKRIANEDEAATLFRSAAKYNAVASYLIPAGFAAGWLSSQLRWWKSSSLGPDLRVGSGMNSIGYWRPPKILGVLKPRVIWSAKTIPIRHFICASLGSLAGKALADTIWTLDEKSTPILKEYYQADTHYRHKLRSPILSRNEIPQPLPFIAPLLGLTSRLYSWRSNDFAKKFEGGAKRKLSYEELRHIYWREAKRMQLNSYGKPLAIVAGTYFAIIRTLPFRQPLTLISIGCVLARTGIYTLIGVHAEEWLERVYIYRCGLKDPGWKDITQLRKSKLQNFSPPQKGMEMLSNMLVPGFPNGLRGYRCPIALHPWTSNKRLERNLKLLGREMNQQETCGIVYAHVMDDLVSSYTIPVGGLIAMWRIDRRALAIRTASEAFGLLFRGAVYVFVGISLGREVGFELGLQSMRNDPRLKEWVEMCEV